MDEEGSYYEAEEAGGLKDMMYLPCSIMCKLGVYTRYVGWRRFEVLRRARRAKRTRQASSWADCK